MLKSQASHWARLQADRAKHNRIWRKKLPGRQLNYHKIDDAQRPRLGFGLVDGLIGLILGFSCTCKNHGCEKKLPG